MNGLRRYWERLKVKWNLKSDRQGGIIMLVFAVTGFSILFVKNPVFELFGYRSLEPGFWKVIAYIAIIYPLYQLLLITWGTLFGQFKFFIWMIKKMNGRFIQPFIKKK